MVTAQSQKGIDQTCSKYIHDHVDIHAMAQTTGVQYSMDTKDSCACTLTSGAVFVLSLVNKQNVFG